MKASPFTVPYYRIERPLLALGVALLPVYIFSSGGIQPAHMVIALFSAVFLAKRSFPRTSWAILLFSISAYSFLVESIYTILGGSSSAIMSSIFFIYNFIVVSSVYVHCRNYGLSALVPGLKAACVIAVSSVIISGVTLYANDEGRSAGGFNNPNQLGYFSVCLLSLTYLLYCHRLLKYVTALSMFFVALFLSIVSLSKAAMVSNIIVFLFVINPMRVVGSNGIYFLFKYYMFWFFLSASVVLSLIFFYEAGYFENYKFIPRLQGMISEADSSLESRGYFAFLDGNFGQLVFGLGRDGVLDIVGHEVHSTLAGVLNDYGLLGFLLFFCAISVWILQLFRAYGFVGMSCIAGPAMLYGITHNGIRFTIFWILFSSSMAMAGLVIKRAKNKYYHRSKYSCEVLDTP